MRHLIAFTLATATLTCAAAEDELRPFDGRAKAAFYPDQLPPEVPEEPESNLGAWIWAGAGGLFVAGITGAVAFGVSGRNGRRRGT